MGLAWNGFGWASPTLEPYMSLKGVLESADAWGVPRHLSPFHDDEGNFLSFDTRVADEQSENPVVFWDHDVQCVLEVRHYQWDNFLSWLEADLERSPAPK